MIFTRMEIQVYQKEKNNKHVKSDEVELYSSASTLSDMEIFVFPDLLYSLVISNILSPKLWNWKNDSYFKDIKKLKTQKKLSRLRQYMVENYKFNLDLATWGMTTRHRELARFKPYLNEHEIAKHNVFLGCSGHAHYFASGIRSYFGMNSSSLDIVPYWKTETLEAMDAYIFREGHQCGAGECVSFSALYAAAMFVICDIPLDDIFLIVTPLHSQSYIKLDSGYVTNNRRIVTKSMWFNGTDRSFKAQRAIRHEQISIVSHHTGYIHCEYPISTIHPDRYSEFQSHFINYLKKDIDESIIFNFLRQNKNFQKYFQFYHFRDGISLWIEAEIVYDHESSVPYKANDKSLYHLLSAIDKSLYHSYKISSRIDIATLYHVFKRNMLSSYQSGCLSGAEFLLDINSKEVSNLFEKFADFVHLNPKFPENGRMIHHKPSEPLPIFPEMSLESLRNVLMEHRCKDRVADIAFYAHRDFGASDWKPFTKAALERNPVSIHATQGWTCGSLIKMVQHIPNISIYNGMRMAQPDEVWNFRRGDGAEKALMLANILAARYPDDTISIHFAGRDVRIFSNALNIKMKSSKNLIGYIKIN